MCLLSAPVMYGCGNGSSGGSSGGGTSETQEVVQIVAGVALSIAEIFFKHPVIRALKYIGIVGDVVQALGIVADKMVQKGEPMVVNFAALNPGVTGTIDLANEATNIQVPFATPKGSVAFSPFELIQTNNLQGDDSVRRLDEKLLADYRHCSSKALESGEGNHIKLLELRAQCFEEMGYGGQTHAYLRIKHETYENT